MQMYSNVHVHVYMQIQPCYLLATFKTHTCIRVCLPKTVSTDCHGRSVCGPRKQEKRFIFRGEELISILYIMYKSILVHVYIGGSTEQCGSCQN